MMRLFLPLLLLALCFTLTVHAQEEQEQVDHANSISITDLIVPPPLLNRTQWTPEEAVLYGQPVGSRCSDEVDAPGVITLYGLIFNPYPVKLSKDFTVALNGTALQALDGVKLTTVVKKGSKKLKETSRVLDHTFESGDFVVGGKDKKSIPWIIGGGDFKMKMKLSGKEGQTYECYEVHFKVK